MCKFKCKLSSIYEYKSSDLAVIYLQHLTRAAQCGAGIDVSAYQGSISWERVKEAGITFAVARATEGQGKQDSYFERNWSGMKTNNITPAAYHYFKGLDTGESQATNIKSTLSNTDFDLNADVLAVDVESALNTGVSATLMAETLKYLLGNISDITHVYIYSNYYYWENHVAWNMYDFSKYNLWVAYWTNMSTPIIPTTWKSKGYTWWQYSDKGNVDGISGAVDLDRSASGSC